MPQSVSGSASAVLRNQATKLVLDLLVAWPGVRMISSLFVSLSAVTQLDSSMSNFHDGLLADHVGLAQAAFAATEKELVTTAIICI